MRREGRGHTWLIPMVACAALLVGCKGSGTSTTTDRDSEIAAALPTYDEAVKTYNARVERLKRIWARAVMSVRFTDADGDRRYEQGNGHFQYESMGKLALSIGKAGETLVWLGYDEQRYWVFDLQKDAKVFVGAHATLSRERAAKLGMPALPRELPMLLGIAALPSADGTVSAAEEKGLVRVSFPNESGGVWRVTLNPATGDGRHVELLTAIDGERLINATLEEDGAVKLIGVGGYFPRMSTRTRIIHEPSNTEMLLTLGDQQEREINPVSFDFEKLCDALGPVTIENVDDETPR